MKNINMKLSGLHIALSAFVAFGILLSSCKKEEPVVEEPDTSDFLGNTANSFSAIVDGTVFNETLITSTNTNGRIVLTASKDGGNSLIRLYIPTNIEKGSYDMTGVGAAYRGFYVSGFGPGQQFSTTTSNGSTLTITGHDTNNDVLTGTFSFKPFVDTNTVSPNEYVTISGGEFAINY